MKSVSQVQAMVVIGTWMMGEEGGKGKKEEKTKEATNEGGDEVAMMPRVELLILLGLGILVLTHCEIALQHCTT